MELGGSRGIFMMWNFTILLPALMLRQHGAVFLLINQSKIHIMSKIIGIDPGSGGGLAVTVDGQLLELTSMPETDHDVNSFFLRHEDADCAYLEQVHSMPGQGVASTFKFGMNYGFLRAMLTAHGIRWIDVTPPKWQSALGIRAIKDEPKTAHKNRLKGRAQQLFPKWKITLKTADAALIAYYGHSINH